MSKPLVERTEKQKADLRALAIRNDLPELIYEDFATYANYMVPTFTTDKLSWEWFHYYISNNFQDIITGELDYLTIETHPQLGKSVLTALAITYMFGCNPDISIMYFTYNERRATAFTKSYIFNFMGSDKYRKIFKFVGLKNDLNKNDHTTKVSMKKKQSILSDAEFNIVNPHLLDKEYRGKYMAFGIGQGAQGNPADIMIVDDYVAKGENVRSEGFRSKLYQSFYDDIVSRFQPSTRFMIICTRWYQTDPIGQLNEAMSDIYAINEKMNIAPPTFRSIKIRTEYRTSDINPIEDPRTTDGEYLWLNYLNKYIFAKKGENYEAVYNCDPTELEKQNQLRVEDFGFYYPDELPKVGCRKIIVMDGASTVKAGSDKTAIGLYYVFGRKRYLIKLWYFRRTVPQLQRYMEDLLTIEHPDYTECLIEFANSGVGVYQYLQEKGIRCYALGFNGKVIDDNKKVITSKKDITSKTNSKMDRYLRHMSEYNHADKRMYLPYNAIEHQSEFIRQLTTFAGEDGKEDDLVDIHTYLVNYTAQTVIFRNENQNVNLNNPHSNSGMCYNLPNAKYLR